MQFKIALISQLNNLLSCVSIENNVCRYTTLHDLWHSSMTSYSCDVLQFSLLVLTAII